MNNIKVRILNMAWPLKMMLLPIFIVFLVYYSRVFSSFMPVPFPVPLLFLTVILLVPLLFTAKLETLLYITILAVPFDHFKFGPLSASNVLIFLLAARWLMDICLNRIKFVFDWSFIPLLGFMIVSLMSILAANDFPLAIRTGVTLYGMIMLCIMIINICTTRACFNRLIKFLLIATIIPVIIGVIQFFGYFMGIQIFLKMEMPVRLLMIGRDYFPRISSVSFDCNWFAFSLLPVVIYGLFQRGEKLVKRYAYFLLVIMLLTFSRGAIIPLLLLLGWLLFVRIAEKIQIKVLLPIIMPMILTAIVLFVFFAANLFIGLNQRSVFARANIINSAIDMIIEKPLIGQGLGQGVIVQVDNDLARYARVGASDDLMETHNTPLQILIYMGICGFIFYYWFIAFILKKWIRVRKEPENDVLLKLKGMVTALIVMAISSVFLSMLLTKILWIVPGIIISGLNIIRNKEYEEQYAQ